jgi:alkylation response protein AidB-like acyl-CoA dehydrogenase
LIMDFTVHDELEAHRSSAISWLDSHIRPEWVQRARQIGHQHDPEAYELLAHAGIFGAGWPAQYGGSDVDVGFAAAVLEELAARGMRSLAWSNTWMVIKTILEAGTEEQRQAYIAPALRGEVRFALGYTEPSAGSDVAAARTRAIRRGDDWVINGAKMFTSTARIATHVILLTRTNTEVPKHRGLTLFLVPLDAPGVDIQPIHTMGDHPTNATYYADVVVPDSARLGEVDSGWSVMRVALVFERSGGLRQVGETVAERVAGWARTQSIDGRPMIDEPVVRHKLATIAIDDEVARLLYLQVDWITAQHRLPGVEGSMAKLFATERNQVAFSDLMDIAGTAGLLTADASQAPLDGLIEHDFRTSVVTTIYGGASEVLRDIIAERRLGLPRSRPTT